MKPITVLRSGLQISEKKMPRLLCGASLESYIYWGRGLEPFLHDFIGYRCGITLLFQLSHRRHAAYSAFSWQQRTGRSIHAPI